jgi:cytochrome c oxidase subunit 3
VTARAVIDVSDLPNHAFGSRSVMWWATLSIIAIEGTVFLIAIASYFYLQGGEVHWPPGDTAVPSLFWANVNLVVLLLSLIPNHFVKKAAEGEELAKVRRWMPVADLFAVAFVVVRVFEFQQLNVSWDSNAYGSVTWTLLGLHTVHLVTDLMDSLVLTALVFTRHGKDPRRLVDVAENSFYWYFVVFAWFPLYAVIFWAPRIL